MADDVVETTLVNAEDTNSVLLATPPAVIEALPVSQPQAVWNEAFMWRAHYTDGTMWAEVDSLGNDYGFATIDLTRLRALEILPMRPGLVGAAVSIRVDDGMRPIFFRRRAVLTTPEGVETGRMTATCLGWQKTLEVEGEKRNTASYTFFLEDGSVLLTDDPDIF